MSTISVQLTADRTQGGMLTIKDHTGAQVGYGLSVLGKAAIDNAAAHGNRACDPLQLFGDTPTGSYNFLEMTEFVAPYNNAHSYGPYGVIRMDPATGDAYQAKLNGRTGILIHAGDLGPGGTLRRTNGCLRLMNEEYKYLKDQINALSVGDPLTRIDVTETGTPAAQPCADNSSCEESDPPPGF